MARAIVIYTGGKSYADGRYKFVYGVPKEVTEADTIKALMGRPGFTVQIKDRIMLPVAKPAKEVTEDQKEAKASVPVAKVVKAKPGKKGKGTKAKDKPQPKGLPSQK